MGSLTIEKITLHDLMAEDFSVWLGINNKFGYDLHIEGYDSNSLVVEDKQIHPCAIDSFAKFCARFLNHYEKINQEDES